MPRRLTFHQKKNIPALSRNNKLADFMATQCAENSSQLNWAFCCWSQKGSETCINFTIMSQRFFNWDTNEPINFRLFHFPPAASSRVKVLFAIFMHDMVPYSGNPLDHLANYLEFIWVDPFENHLHATLSLLSGVIHTQSTHPNKFLLD